MLTSWLGWGVHALAAPNCAQAEAREQAVVTVGVGCRW